MQIADAQHQLAARKTLRRRLRFLDQGQSRTVADLAADGTEREIISLRVLEQQAADKRLTENFPRMPAAASPAVGAAGSIAVRRPFAVPVAAAGNDGVGIAVLAADAGMQGIPRLRAGGLNCAGFIGMSQRVKLLIGGVAAAGAGVVLLPALFRAGGGLAGMADQVVVVRVLIAAFKGIRRMIAALGTGPVIYSPGYAGGFGLEMLCVSQLHE